MAVITPNFNFSGQCEEAIKLYQKAFHGEIKCLLYDPPVAEEDAAMGSDSAGNRYVYHAELLIGGQRIMMADNRDVPFAPSGSLSLTVTMDTKEEVLRAFDVLKEGCEILYPVHRTSYSSCMGSLYDKFGFRWVIMTER